MTLGTQGLYAIVDVDAWRARGIELVRPGVLEAVANAILAARPSAIQLRAKCEGGETTLDLLRRLRPLVREAATAMVVNDRVDLALLAGADAVHLGQDDLPLEEARRIGPSLAIGLSTHDAGQLEDALRGRPDYVAFGPVFPTASKTACRPDPPDPVVGLDRLAAAGERARSADVPLVAIGGLTVERASRVFDTSVRWGAVIGALVVAANGVPDLPEITRRARVLDAALRGRS